MKVEKVYIFIKITKNRKNTKEKGNFDMKKKLFF